MTTFPNRRVCCNVPGSYRGNFESDTYPRIQLDAGDATAGMTHAQFCIVPAQTTELSERGGMRAGWILPLILPRRAPSRGGVCDGQGATNQEPPFVCIKTPATVNNDNEYMRQVKFLSPLLPGSVGAASMRFDVRYEQIVYG